MDGQEESRTRDNNNKKKQGGMKGGQGFLLTCQFSSQQLLVTNYTQNVAVQTANTYMCNSAGGGGEGGGRSVERSVGRKLVLSFFSSLASIILSRLLYAGCLVSIYSSLAVCNTAMLYNSHIQASGIRISMHTQYIHKIHNFSFWITFFSF